jgi:hypothetical protein
LARTAPLAFDPLYTPVDDFTLSWPGYPNRRSGVPIGNVAVERATW